MILVFFLYITLPSALPKEPSVSLDDGNLTSYRKLLFSKLDLIVKGLNSLQSEKTRNAVIFEGNLVNFTKTFTDSVTLPLNDYSELVALDLALGSVELSVSMVCFPFSIIFPLQISHFSCFI
jgi:hypothetical protein